MLPKINALQNLFYQKTFFAPKVVTGKISGWNFDNKKETKQDVGTLLIRVENLRKQRNK